MPSKQFLIWIAFMATTFAVSVITLDALGLSTIWVFVAGIAFAELTDKPMQWLQDWQQVEQQVQTDNSGKPE